MFRPTQLVNTDKDPLLPVPALNNMTPREAAKTEEGSELLESLLLDYEHHNDSPTENLMRPDIPELRCKLGMGVRTPLQEIGREPLLESPGLAYGMVSLSFVSCS